MNRGRELVGLSSCVHMYVCVGACLCELVCVCVCARARVSATIDSSSSLCVRLLSVSQSCVSESQPSTDLGRNKKHLAFASSGGSRGQIRPWFPIQFDCRVWFPPFNDELAVENWRMY